ncbi:hypothetical protein GCM10011584_19930 [Nocardioides phosphati]|uniref:Uncharacterized protein n=1 Tax=Nocardioides phosphati TaxID=1867775 RepID=A0ABQ2N9R7_9ACTN|nr:hypothetical protein [Nocardioides phosphati]GGO89744.1 hypothetical protein GCM10011584_19930 [Nocardioides phosphati]
MRKLALVIGSLAAVVLLALLVHVADEGDGVTYQGSWEQLGHHPHGHLHGHRPCDPPQATHGRVGGRVHGRVHGRMPGLMPGLMPGRMHGRPPGRGCGEVPELRTVGCHRSDGGITLTYAFGALDTVAPFIEPRGRGIVVGVKVWGPPRGTIVTTQLMLGTASFPMAVEPVWIRDPAGRDVPCPRGEPLVRRAP